MNSDPPLANAIVRNNELASRTPSRVADRDAERTRLFAVAVIQVAQEAGVFFLVRLHSPPVLSLY